MATALEKMAHELLSERLREIGFQPYDLLSFYRTMDYCKQLIIVCSRSERGKLKFYCKLGVNFAEIESLLRPDRKKQNEFFPTAACPIHLLRPERAWYEWEAGNGEELTIAVESMVAEIHEVGLEFLDRFATLEAVEEELSRSKVSQCLMLSPHQHSTTLAAIVLVRGDRTSAEHILADALKDPRNQHPGMQRRIEEIRAHLLEGGPPPIHY